MRKYFIVLYLLLSLSQLKAQDTTAFGDKTFSIGTNEGLKSFTGNNFISKTYKASASTTIDIRFRIYGNWGIGGGGEWSSPSLKSLQYVGNSTSATMTNWFGYLFYNVYLGKKWMFVPKIGTGSYRLTNTLEANDYYKTYTYSTHGYSYFAAPEINFFLTKHISANAVVQYTYINLRSMNANESVIGTNYHKTNQFLGSIGVRFWL